MDLFGFISTLASLLVKGLESIYAFLIYLMNFPTRISVVLSSMPNYISYTKRLANVEIKPNKSIKPPT